MRLKLITTILVFCIILIFTSCGNTSSASADSVSSASSEEIKVSSQETMITSSSEETISEVKVVEPPEGNFRVGFWGDDAETIKKYETAEFYGEAEGGLVYYTDVAGKPAYVFYSFDEVGALYQGGYQFTTIYKQGALYISEYNILKESLSSKYGSPEIDEIKKLSKLADYADEGMALELGYTMYQTKWKVENTEILLAMISQTDDVIIILNYSDVNHGKVHNTEGL